MRRDDKTKWPLITMGLTSYNAQDTIEAAIDGALKQNYPNKELVIVDDCSSDNSVSVIEARIKGEKNITFIKHNKNKGFAGALNSIITHAAGEFIAIFDDDDVSVPSRLKTQLSRILAHEKETGQSLLACWASGYREYENGYRAVFEAIGSKPKIPVGEDLIKAQLYMGREPDVFFGCGTPSCSLMVRKSTYDAVGLYDTSMRRTEDTDFALRLARKGGHFIGCPDQLLQQTASVGHDKRPEIGYQSELNLIAKHKDLFDPARRYEYAKLWIKLRYHHFGQERLKSIWTLAQLFIRFPLWTWEQFWRSAPKRLAHEKSMKAKQPS